MPKVFARQRWRTLNSLSRLVSAPEAVAKANEFGLAIFAGALSPTEVQIGADAVKLFPCFASGGPRYLKALRGQYDFASTTAGDYRVFTVRAKRLREPVNQLRALLNITSLYMRDELAKPT
jgi:hypothetical protein